jgi:hypothetical protein
MNKWNNKLSTGVLLGIFSPPLAFLIFFLFAFPGENVVTILHGYAARNVLTHVISLSVIINLPLFFIFLQSNLEQSARGVLGATLLYAFLILIMKLT